MEIFISRLLDICFQTPYNVPVQSMKYDMKKHFFVDSENVGDNWITLLHTAASEDEILVFYTSKSPNMNYKNLITLKQSEKEVTFIECYSGNNALDFQLSTELGYRIKGSGQDEFIILANDTGYDAVVKYWKDRGNSVKRVNAKAIAALEDSKQEEMKEIPSDAVEASASNIDDGAKEILAIIGKANLQLLHEALRQLYGTKKGRSIYNAFKMDTAYNHFIAKHKNMNLAEKHHAYCTIVFSVMAPDEVMPDDFPKHLLDFWLKKRNLNSLKALLQQKYGKENGARYYSLFKVHIKILDKMK